MRTDLNFSDQAWNRLTANCRFKNFNLPLNILPQILIEDSGNLKHPKNVKSISNTTVSHLVSCHVVPFFIKKRCSEKYMLLEI